MSEAQRIDIVTFDIFDTLVHRKIWAPADIFECVRLKLYEHECSLLMHDTFRNFPYDRIKAESNSRKRRQQEHGGDAEVTFDEIYAEYAQLTGCPSAILDLIKSTELYIEEHMLVTSPIGLELYNKYRSAGKNIAFISDMYLPSDWLSQMLEAKGFSGATELPLFVSCEHRASKHSGSLYEVTKKQLAISDTQRWLHIGDNKYADINNAQKHNIQTHHADWSTIDNRFLPASGAGANHIVAKIISFLETKQASQYIPKDNLEAIGYQVFGPLLFGFNTWLLNACRESKLKKMVFVARDGWLLRSLFEKSKSLAGLSDVQTHYLHMSRKVGYQSGIREWDLHTNWYLIGGRTPSKLLKSFKNANINIDNNQRHLSNFGLHDVDTLPSNPDYNRFKQALDTLFYDSLTSTKANREQFRDYYNVLPDGDEPIGLVDIGWAGNIQKSLIHAIGDVSARERVHGLYLGTLSSSNRMKEKGLQLKGWICNGGAPHHWEQLLTSGAIEILEFLLTADHGSTLSLQKNEDGTIHPIMEELSEAEAPYREKALRVQAGANKFFDDYAFLLTLYDPATLITSAWINPFERLVSNPTDLELEELAGLTHSNLPGANDDRQPLASRQPFHTRYRKRHLKRARDKSYWKAAFDKLNKGF